MRKRFFGLLSITILLSTLLLVGCGSKKETIIVGTEAGFTPMNI